MNVLVCFSLLFFCCDFARTQTGSVSEITESSPTTTGVYGSSSTENFEKTLSDNPESTNVPSQTYSMSTDFYGSSNSEALLSTQDDPKSTNVPPQTYSMSTDFYGSSNSGAALPSTQDYSKLISACIDPPEQIPFEISETGNFNVSLSWESPENSCITEYVIYLDGEENARTKETTYTIENLDACVTYSVGLAASSDTQVGEKTETQITTTVPDPFGYQVSNLEINKVDDVLNATWSPPSEVSNCITSYSIVFWDQSNKPRDDKTTNSYYELTPIIGCMTYHFQVIPVVSENIQGNSAITDHTSEELPTNPPMFIRMDIGKTTANITWGTDTYLANMCNIKEVTVICQAPDDKNSNYDWIAKYPAPTVQKIVDSSERPRIEITVEDLSEFTNYTCQGMVTNTGGNSSLSSPVEFMTAEEVPFAPRLLKISDINPTNFTITWNEPAKVPGVMLNYGIHIEATKSLHTVGKECLDLRDDYFDVESNQYEFTYENAYPDFNYVVSVYGVDRAGNGSSSKTEAVTLTTAPGPPIYLENISYPNQDTMQYDVTVEIDWTSPCNTNGPLKGFQLEIDGYYVEDNTNSDHRMPFVDKNQVETDFDYQYNITNIAAASSYSVTVYAVLADDTKGEEVTLSFISPDGYPGAPILKEVGNETETSFSSHWLPPEQNFGKILHYNIVIKPVSPLHEVPQDDECVINKDAIAVQVEGDVNNHKYEKALANYKYSVHVNAATSAGFGPNSEEKLIATKEAKSEIVRNLETTNTYSNVEEYKGVASVKYERPCNTNGPFKNYQINYQGTRKGFKDHTDSINTLETSVDISLRPDYDYSIEIQVVTEQFNAPAPLIYFHSRPGVPLLGKPPDVPKSNGTTTGYFTLPKSAFDNTNGDIKYYALFLMPKSANVTSNNYGFWDGTESSWPPVPSTTVRNFKPYQLTELFWNPFEDGDDIVHFRIGVGKNCSNNKFCNKALHENTEYSLIVRGLTSATYRDSQPLSFKTEPMKSLDLGLILGLVFGLSAAAILIIFIIILWRRKKRTLIEEEVIRTSASDPAPIDIKKFVAHYEFIKENYNVLKAQFTTLGIQSKEIVLETTYAVLPENKRKNRYTNILPYDETRVKLQIDEDDEIGSDYINASYIKGYTGKVEYIATQGPLESTSKDFWKMVFQENVSIIVMVSQFVEQSKEKCYKYFPSNHETLSLGENFEVKCLTELHFGIYCMRTLQMKKDTTQRNVIHMQFLEWPDFGVPSGTDHILQFCCQMRERVKTEGGIIVVHCSAGVGRTGTLIATDMLLQTIDDHRDINIFKTVLDLRKQRTNMVQTEKQYMFIHTCVRDALETPVIRTYEKHEEPLYENMNVIKSSLEDNLIPIETESAL